MKKNKSLSQNPLVNPADLISLRFKNNPIKNNK